MTNINRRDLLKYLLGVSAVAMFPACQPKPSSQNDKDKTDSPQESAKKDDVKEAPKPTDIAETAPAFAVPARSNCLECSSCMPCRHGVDIPGNLGFINAAINNKTLPTQKDDPNTAAFLSGYDQKLPLTAQADKCVQCRHCLRKCPQAIDIPAQLDIIAKYVSSLRNP